MYERCFNILDTIIDNQYFCKYNQYIVAMSVIYLIFNSSNYFDVKVFKYIYGVDFSKEKYKLCINSINLLVTNIYKIKFNDSFSNMNINIIKNNYYFNNYNVNNNNNNYFLDGKIHNDFQLNPKSDMKDLIFKYINIIESIKSDSCMSSTNKMQLLNNDCLYINALKIFQHNLIENYFIKNDNYKYKFWLNRFRTKNPKNI